MTVRRVVQVVRSDGFSGVERYIVDVATELHCRGWEVVVIGGDPARMRIELSHEIAFHPAARLVDVGRELWRARKCNVVHAHMTAAELPAAMLKSRLSARLVVTRHFATAEAISPAGRLARKVIAHRVDRFIAISDFVANALAEPNTVIHNGTSATVGAFAARNPTVVMVQRLEAEKDTATGIRAWAASGLADAGWRLIIHGRGSHEDELRVLASDLGVRDSVAFAGFVADARAVIAQASVMLATAPAEPFGLAVVEAMAEATPVVAARGGAHVETLGVLGTYFVPGDADSCARELRALAEDAQRRAKLGRDLQARQRRHFTVVAHVDKLERLYAE
jgi:glycosyltransferase involved in cell wall biosynthesis